ncbi:hypothetical protein CVT26_009339 [Gymnopilus dilepis]|uniref:Uncharacterized protein n=1 Tax=Gymnopilus dilepis TaxID=231916 RepID=A0A409YA70_9AGAR|nr:hypothetical protein CVT26_009339 [Gymnopilus dilepis]
MTSVPPTNISLYDDKIQDSAQEFLARIAPHSIHITTFELAASSSRSTSLSRCPYSGHATSRI